MPSFNVALSNFNPTTNFSPGSIFNAHALGDDIRLAHVIGATLTLEGIMTWASNCYLEISISGYGTVMTTGTLALNNAVHTQTVTLSGVHDGLLHLNGVTLTFMVRRASGTGNAITIRSGTTGYITVTYSNVPKPAFIKSGGIWRTAAAYVKSGGIWRESKAMYVKSGGVWREVIGGWG